VQQHQLGRFLAVSAQGIFDAARGLAATIFGQLIIIMVVYLPILTLTGIEGKMLPDGHSAGRALGAMILSITLFRSGRHLRDRTGGREGERAGAWATKPIPSLRGLAEPGFTLRRDIVW
jgi:hypothetical protein